MITLNDFFLFLFLVGMGGIIIIFPSFLNLLIIGEVIWISLYCYIITGGTSFDSLLLLIWGLFMLCLAAGESTVGLGLLMFKYIFYGTNKLKSDVSNEKLVGYSNFLN